MSGSPKDNRHHQSPFGVFLQIHIQISDTQLYVAQNLISYSNICPILIEDVGIAFYSLANLLTDYSDVNPLLFFRKGYYICNKSIELVD